MRIEFLRKSMPIPNGCCGLEFPNESEALEKNLLQVLEELGNRKWINTVSIVKELGTQKELIIYHFPENLRKSEKYKIKKLPAIIVNGEVIIEGEVPKEEIKKKILQSFK